MTVTAKRTESNLSTASGKALKLRLKFVEIQQDTTRALPDIYKSCTIKIVLRFTQFSAASQPQCRHMPIQCQDIFGYATELKNHLSHGHINFMIA